MEPDTSFALVGRWIDAERSASLHDLKDILAEDFRGVGPVGYVLQREDWLARFSRGWVYESLAVQDLSFRQGDGFTIGIGTLTQTGAVDGRRSEGRFRVTFVIDTLCERLVGLQLTPIRDVESAPS